MPGWLSWANVRASRRNRSSSSGPPQAPRPEHLDRHRPPQLRIPRLEDPAVRARAELPEEFVAPQLQRRRRPRRARRLQELLRDGIRVLARARQDVEQLVHLLLPVSDVAGAHCLQHARFEVLPEHELLHLLDRALHGRELQEDVDAGLVLLHHALNALHLPLDAAEPAQGLRLRLSVHDQIPRIGRRCSSMRMHSK